MRSSARFHALGTLPFLAAATLFATTMDRGGQIFTTDGAWCWFSEPRAIFHQGRIVAGWVTSDGSIQVGSRPLTGGDTTIATLAPLFEKDDHDHPTFATLPDGRLAAFFSRHSKGDMFFTRTSSAADHASWEPWRTLGFIDPSRGPRGVTYAHPFHLAQDNSLWVFWRGSDFKPTFAISRDQGDTWGPPITLISEQGRDTSNRPYTKYASDGLGRIHILFTDGHPRNEPDNSVYYARYERGAFWRADGTKIGTFDELPLQPGDCDKVYDGRTAGRAWIWSIVSDPHGNPVIGYTRLPSEQDHRYHYARWDGARWADHEITPAGSWFPHTPPGEKEREPHYSGGLTIDPADPGRVYAAVPVNGVFEIEEFSTPDGGSTWTRVPVTAHSTANNVRPVVVSGTPPGTTVVMWMHNLSYVHYTRYHTQLRYSLR